MRFQVAAFLLVSCVVAQAQSALHDMVKTEHAFSKMAQDKSIRDAFMTYIADDGLLFRPGAVNGKKWMIEHPAPPSDKKPVLTWQPAFAGMSRAGDLGFTTGPWESKADINDQKPSGYGHFVTLWKKQADGSWKFVVDLGISHPQSGGSQKLWRPNAQQMKPDQFAYPMTPEDLMARERKYADLAKQGLFEAFLSYSSPEIRLYRVGSLPFIGIKPAADAFVSTKGQLTWQPLGADVSRSGDLGYTHGTYEITDNTQKVIERGSYVHIWKKNDTGSWRVVLDVANPH